MTIPLYEEHRPKRWQDVVGQEKAVSRLQRLAERARAIAQAEGLDGQPLAAYVRLVQRHHNNMRGVLQDVESGVML